MKVFSEITTMHINNTKTPAIYLGQENEQPNPAQNTPNTPNYTWAKEGRYLGFMLGPKATNSSWDTPIKKYTGRLTEWPWKQIGTHLSVRVYNTFILPTLLFVAQLQQPPPHAYQAEQKVPGKILAGRGGWCKTNDLMHLRNLGVPI